MSIQAEIPFDICSIVAFFNISVYSNDKQQKIALILKLTLLKWCR